MATANRLLERETELAAVAAAATAAAAGSGRLLVLEGPAGIGKTSLLASLDELPEWSGHPILRSRGTQLETPFAYGIVRQLFEPLLADTPHLLSGAAANAVRVFNPTSGPPARALNPAHRPAGPPAPYAAELSPAASQLPGDRPAALTLTTPSPGDGAEFATLHGLFWMTANLCERPVALVIDDLHWADVASLRYLAYLQTRLQSLPLLVLASVRSGEAAADDVLLARILADPEVQVSQPAPLTVSATSNLLEATIGASVDKIFATASYQATSGNPLLLRALARTLTEEGVAPIAANSPRVLELGHRALSRLVAVRLAGMRPETLAVARSLAILGQGADVTTLRALAGLDELTAAESIQELTRLGLIESSQQTGSGGQRVGFVHPVVSGAVYGEIPVRERAAAHAKAAELLDRSGAAADQVGAHQLNVPAGVDPAAVERLRRAAAMALGRGSPEAAFTFLDRCLDEPMDDTARTSVLAEAASVAIQVDLQAAVRILEEARSHAQDPMERARIGLQLGAARGFLHDPDRAFEALIEARDALPATEDDLRRRLEATMLVGAVVAPGRLEVVDRVPELAALAPDDSLGGRMLAAVIGLHEMARCDPTGGTRAEAALADGLLVRQTNGEGALVCGWITLLAADDPAGLRSLDAAVTQAQLTGSLRALAASHCFRSLGLLWTGQLEDAEEEATTALELAETGRVDMDHSFAGAYLAEARMLRGDLAGAESVLRSVDVTSPDPAGRPRYYALDAWAQLLYLQGRYADSLTAARIAGEVWQAFGFDNPALGSWRSVAGLASHRLGEPEQALDYLQAELDLARRWQAPRALGRALRVLGEITGDLEPLRESVDVLEQSPARLTRAASLIELGAAVRRTGARGEARELLSRGLDEAELCGAGSLSDRAAAELRVAGFRPRRHRITGRESLTAGELRVAELASGGATNREIAQALFVTTKTVEVHLSSVYRKLGVAGRGELAGHLQG